MTVRRATKLLSAGRIQRILKEGPEDGIAALWFTTSFYDRFRRLGRTVIDTVIAVTAEMVTTMVNIGASIAQVGICRSGATTPGRQAGRLGRPRCATGETE